MTVSIDIADQDVFTALATFLKSFLPTGTIVIQAQTNQAPMPIGPFVLMNNGTMERNSTNVNSYTATTSSHLTGVTYTMQLDFLGPDSQAWAMMAQSLFRDEYANDVFTANIQPLFSDDPMQIPLIDAESQYEQRWKLVATLQYNPTITTDQQTANAVKINIKPIDQTFAP